MLLQEDGGQPSEAGPGPPDDGLCQHDHCPPDELHRKVPLLLLKIIFLLLSFAPKADAEKKFKNIGSSSIYALPF